MTRWPSITTFIKAQFSAFSGGLADYLLMIFLTEQFHIHFVLSILISGTIGGLVNFCINKFWAFKSKNGYNASFKKQFIKFIAVVVGSISLKSAGTFLLKHTLNIDYRIGRLLIDSFVSYGFNYPLMKFWVFKSNLNINQHTRVVRDMMY